MAYIYDLSDTWNAAGTTFFGIKMNVTNSASASGSKLLSLQVAGTEYFGVDKDGNVTIGNGGDLNISSATGGDASKIYNDAEDLYFSTNGSNRMLINSSGNIGIGNTSPGAKLDVTGNIRLSASSPNIELNNGGPMIYSTASNTLMFATGGGPSSPVERMRIDSTGNLGVGTSSPSTYSGVLNVKASDRAVIGYFGGTTYATRLGANSSYATIEAVDAATGTSSYQPLQIGGSLLKFDTGGSERMRIDSSGNVGIGTSSPGYKLDVNGTGSFVGSSGVGAIRIAGAGGSWFWIDNPTTTTMRFSSGSTAGTNPMVLDSSGNVGIGTTSPVGSSGYGWLTVNGSNSAMSFSRSNTEHFRVQVVSDTTYLNNIANTPMLFQTNNTERMRIGSNGSVAIGGSGTDASLHIQQAYGGYNRLTQMSPSGTSNNAFNLMAAKNSGGGDNWWSWGVRTDAVWCLVPGVDSALTSSTGIYFDSSAAAYKPGGGTWSATSDARVKTNIAPITDASSRIMSLKPASFDYRVPEAHDGRVSDRGFIAQEFEEVYPHSVTEQEMVCEAEQALFADGDKVKAIGLGTDFFADLVALVQEQQATINDLRARVAQLEGN